MPKSNKPARRSQPAASTNQDQILRELEHQVRSPRRPHAQKLPAIRRSAGAFDADVERREWAGRGEHQQTREHNVRELLRDFVREVVLAELDRATPAAPTDSDIDEMAAEIGRECRHAVIRTVTNFQYSRGLDADQVELLAASVGEAAREIARDELAECWPE